MQTDKDKLKPETADDNLQDNEADSVEWLLDMDYAEEEDRLFQIDKDTLPLADLSDYEAQMAARPLSRGKVDGDDLSLFVSEEIVISSEGQGSSSIYSDGPGATGNDDDYQLGEPMAVDHTLKATPSSIIDTGSLAEGTDVLGLSDEDDIGERFVSIKRKEEPAPRVSDALPAVVADEAETVNAAAIETSTDETVAAGTDAVEADDALPTVSAEPELELEESTIAGELPDVAAADAEPVDDQPQAPGLPEEESSVATLADLAASLDSGSLEFDDEVSTETPELVDTSIASAGDDWLVSQAAEITPVAATDDSETRQPSATDDDEDDDDVDLELQSLDPVELVAELPESEGLALGDELDADAIDSLDFDEELTAAADDADAWPDIDFSDSSDDLETSTVATEITQVAEPGGPEGANELGEDDEALAAQLDESVSEQAQVDEDALEDVDAMASAAAEVPDNVVSYIHRVAPPRDDAGFDDYLLQGEHLQGDTEDLDSLAVEPTAGIISVDPDSPVDIDYHEDFSDIAAMPATSLSAITAVIGSTMAQVNEQVKQRLTELDRSQETVEVDLLLATDALTLGQCREEGYLPIQDVCPKLPAALAELSDAELAAIHLRLVQESSDETLNSLLQVADSAAADATASTADNLLGDVSLDDSALDDDLSLGADVDIGDVDDSSIENLFDDVEQELAEDGSSTDVENELFAALDSVDDTLFSDTAKDTAERDDDSADSDTTPDNVTYLQPGESVPAFDEAMLDDDTGLDDAALAPTDDADVEELLNAFTDEVGELDGICGVDAGDFLPETREPAIAAADVAAAAAPTPAIAAGKDWFLPADIDFDTVVADEGEVFVDFLDAFLEEGSATIEQLEDSIGTWESKPADTETFAQVGRILHTLKGIAKGVGLQRYGTLVHNFETLLDGMPAPLEGSERDYFRIVNAWLDAAVRGFAQVQTQRRDIQSVLPRPGMDDSSAELSDAPSITDDTAPLATQSGDQPSDLMQLTSAERDALRQKRRDKELADEGAKALAAQQSVRITSEKLDQLLNLTNQAQQLGVRSAQTTVRNKRSTAELMGRLTAVRSHISSIADRALLNVAARGRGDNNEMDALEMDRYSELQEAASILREGIEDLADLVDISSRQTSLVEALLKQQSQVISTIGSSIQAARVVPLSRLMPGLRRIVRTVSADLDKSVAFRVKNQMGALDRDNYARLQIILEHMVRNAMDHGIESPEERLAMGKATTGRITVDVRKAGGDYVVTLADDGRGIDPDQMREAAYQKGLEMDVDELSDDEAIALIFHRGFSTAARVSGVSGRGVGMDIVLNELQQVGGGIDIRSTVGEGTAFDVRIPSNVSVNGALMVTTGDHAYAVPLDSLIAVDYVDTDTFFDAVEQKQTLALQDTHCQPAYLGTLCHAAPLPERERWGGSIPVMIAGDDKRRMAIAIDDVQEALELVIRSLGPQFNNVAGLAGAATTAGGDAIVALDLNALVASVSEQTLPAAAAPDSDLAPLVLVVDDSRTQRMVATSQFDTVGVETVTAENGLVAIDLLNSTHRLPDVVLLDIEMPVKDGIQTLREIRSSERCRHIPVIMVTSRTGAKHRALAEEAGCNGYMGKPFNFPALIEQINTLTGHELALD